jgi:EAL domain-containing protein (putative c-di-GMP-specific phosphodiesterase class I)
MDRITLTGDLRRAIASGELELQYQPIVSLRRHEVSGLEALCRWRHPTRGMLMPCEFVGLAEDNGLIHELGRWVVDEAIRSAAQWRREGTPVLGRVMVGVNVSWRQLAQGTLVEDVRGSLQRHGLHGSAFCTEVTETALMEEPRRARAALADLRAMGVHLGLDDFGTGHSSLSVLRDFDLDMIKLDRSFLAGAGEWAIIRAVREMASSLDLLVVAEGIERPDQATRVQNIGCDFGQGWLYSRAAPADALPGVVAELAESLRTRR